MTDFAYINYTYSIKDFTRTNQDLYAYEKYKRDIINWLENSPNAPTREEFEQPEFALKIKNYSSYPGSCLLYTSDAADE